MLTRARVLAVVGLVVALTAVAACGSDKKSDAGSTASTTTAPTPPSSTPGTSTNPGALAFIKTSGATADEVRCAEAATDTTAMMNCLSLDSIIKGEAKYLRDETEATEAQIKCVSDALRQKGVEEARRLTDSGIGAAVYVPCGLPD